MGQHIVKLTAENVKRLHAVEITPDGSVVIIGGKNEQGKSSVLDAIEMCLGGEKYIPSMPIHTGEKKARIVIDLGDLVVTRVFTASGTRIEVANKDGAVFKSPQAILDSLVGRLTFDPLAFSRMPREGRIKTLKEVMGLDFSEQDLLIKDAYDSRKLVNRDIKTLEGKLAATPKREAPIEEVSILTLTRELEFRQKHNQGIKDKQDALETFKEKVKNSQTSILGLQKQIEDLTAKLEQEKAAYVELGAQFNAAAEEVGKMQMMDTESIQREIGTAEQTNADVRYNIQRAEVEKELEGKKAESKTFTDELDALEGEKAQLLANAKSPVPGLGFNDDDATVDGIPWDQCSTAQQIRNSVRMGIALNPKLRIILIREGSSLDEDNLALVAKEAAENDMQIWIERVSQGEECSVILEDGSIKS